MLNDPLLAYRERFPILERCNYLVSHSLGAMPRDVYGSMAQYAEDWATHGVGAWGERWWALNGVVGDQFAEIIHAPPGSISMHPNASIVLSILLSAMDFSDARRNRVVVSSLIFHTDFLCAQRAVAAAYRTGRCGKRGWHSRSGRGDVRGYR